MRRLALALLSVLLLLAACIDRSEERPGQDDSGDDTLGIELEARDTHWDNNGIGLWWEDPAYPVEYWTVERAEAVDGPWRTVAVLQLEDVKPAYDEQQVPTHDRWFDGELPPAEQFYYRMYACLPDGGASEQSNVVSGVVPEFMPGLEPPLKEDDTVTPPCER